MKLEEFVRRANLSNAELVRIFGVPWSSLSYILRRSKQGTPLSHNWCLLLELLEADFHWCLSQLKTGTADRNISVREVRTRCLGLTQRQMGLLLAKGQRSIQEYETYEKADRPAGHHLALRVLLQLLLAQPKAYAAELLIKIAHKRAIDQSAQAAVREVNRVLFPHRERNRTK